MKKLMGTLGYVFNDLSLLKMALTHRSIKLKNNERLEFLGDSILNFTIASALYEKFPFASEGELSRGRAGLVNEASLAEIARAFHLGDYLNLGPGELKSGGARRSSILADALEAIIGAIYLDANMLCCQRVILNWFSTHLKMLVLTGTGKDAKSLLQEYLQAQKLPLPAYKILSVTGDPHEQYFRIVCEVEGLSYHAEGQGTTRRSAEQMAAGVFYDWLCNKDIANR